MGTLLIVLLILLLVFSDRLAETGRGLGEGVRNFKRALGNQASENSRPVQAPLIQQAPIKLLPAKGETSNGSDPPAKGSASDN